MKNYLLLCFLGISIFGFAQNESGPIKVFPNPFDSLVTHTISIREGDLVGINVFDMWGRSKSTVSSKPYFNSIDLSDNVDSIMPGVYISTIEINGTSFNNKLVCRRRDSSLIFNYHIQVTPYNFEVLKIYPNPNISDQLTIETETEGNSVHYSIYNMSGQVLYKEEVMAVDMKAFTTVFISDWESGQYLVKMESESGKDEEIFTKISD